MLWLKASAHSFWLNDFFTILSLSIYQYPIHIRKSNSHHFLSFYGSIGVRDSMLRSTQPDLINPVRCLPRLNTDHVISCILQFDANGIMAITCPGIETYRMNIQPISQSYASCADSDLIVHLQPN